jgi:ATP-dependent DNA helicase RecQ
VCLGWRKTATRPPDDEEYLQVRIALSAVARLSGRFGAVRIAQVLVGSRAKEVLSWKLDRIPTYGKLQDLSLDQAKELLHLLADSGLVERRTLEGGKPGAFVLSLSKDGRSVMKGEARPDLPLPPRSQGVSVGSIKSKAGEPNLLAHLKAWRLEESQRRGIPAYVVFHDKTLAAIAAAQPLDQRALLRIKGMGPAKLEKYGKTVLEIVRAHLKQS